MVHFGEGVMCQVEKKYNAPRGRWSRGTIRGVCLAIINQNDKCFTGQEDGDVVMSKHIKKRQPEHQWDGKDLLNVKGTPYNMTPQKGGEKGHTWAQGGGNTSGITRCA